MTGGSSSKVGHGVCRLRRPQIGRKVSPHGLMDQRSDRSCFAIRSERSTLALGSGRPPGLGPLLEPTKSTLFGRLAFVAHSWHDSAPSAARLSLRGVSRRQLPELPGGLSVEQAQRGRKAARTSLTQRGQPRVGRGFPRADWPAAARSNPHPLAASSRAQKPCRRSPAPPERARRRAARRHLDRIGRGPCRLRPKAPAAQPFTAPLTIPRTMARWTQSASTRTGNVIRVAAAINAPHCTEL
jgi:hypothetical protein